MGYSRTPVQSHQVHFQPVVFRACVTSRRHGVVLHGNSAGAFCAAPLPMQLVADPAVHLEPKVQMVFHEADTAAVSSPSQVFLVQAAAGLWTAVPRGSETLGSSSSASWGAGVWASAYSALELVRLVAGEAVAARSCEDGACAADLYFAVTVAVGIWWWIL